MSSSQGPWPIKWRCHLAIDLLEACHELGGERSRIINLFRTRSTPDGRILKLIFDFVQYLYD